MSDFFWNGKHKVLEYMAQRQIFVNDKTVVKLSQQEIADILGFIKAKGNNNIRDLKENRVLIQRSS